MTFRSVPLLAALALLTPPAAAAAPVLPDLVGKAPTLDEAGLQHDIAGGRLLLRFDGYVHNGGQGALELRGSDPAQGVMSTVSQRLFEPDGIAFSDQPSAAQVVYETNDSHSHFHFQQATAYSLWTLDRTAQVAPSPKVGFCLEDSAHVDAHGPAIRVYRSGFHPDFNFCGAGDPEQPEVLLGISPGWEDVYGSSLAFQWVDVSGVAPGRYWVAVDTDPDGVIAESNELNPRTFAADEAVVPGWLARPIDAGTVATGTRTTLQLAADAFGSPVGPQYKIVDPPDHGALDRATGEWFDGASVAYTPAPGYSGADSFHYVARDPTSPFPTSPPQAAVGLSVASAPTSVLISGAPARLRAGRGVQLSATVTNGPRQVRWTASKGKVTQRGFYTAPRKVPASGSARIRATGAGGAFDRVSIRILPARKEAPAPSAPGKTRRRGPLSLGRIRRHGNQLLVTARPWRSGRLRVTARRAGRTLGRCSARVSRGRRVLCAITLKGKPARVALYCPVPRASRLGVPGLRVTVTLFSRGRLVAIRRRTL